MFLKPPWFHFFLKKEKSYGWAVGSGIGGFTISTTFSGGGDGAFGDAGGLSKDPASLASSGTLKNKILISQKSFEIFRNLSKTSC